jgi:hypothetical protein
MAGIYYAVHLAAHKAHEFSRQVRDSAILAALPADAGSTGSVDGTIGPGDCRLLSKEDVGRAIGVTIVATRTMTAGCEYLAQGTVGDLTAKHIAAVMASKGVSPEQQQMIQSLSRGILGATQGQGDESSQDQNVNSVVVAFTIAPNAGDSLGTVGPGSKPISGIGDEAVEASGSVMMVRKGNKLLRITYSTCPCTVEAVKPLARRLATSL